MHQALMARMKAVPARPASYKLRPGFVNGRSRLAKSNSPHHDEGLCPCGGGCPRCQEKSASGLDIHGKSAARLERARGELFINDDGPQRQSPPPASGPAPPAPACPTDIRVVETGTLQLDESFAAQGWWTGIGGYAKMQVSDPAGRNWDGTQVHESVEPFTDTCGTADRSCSNRDGEEGDVGSTFTVGEAGDLLGMPLPAQRNCFYDLHIAAMQGVSLLHTLGRPTCVQMCRQQYDCGGVPFGPEFTIHKLLFRDIIVGAGVLYDVTRIDLEKF